MKKNKWEKPKLIVLLKGEPEENVLAGCKLTGTPSGPNSNYNACATTFKTWCKNCKQERNS